MDDFLVNNLDIKALFSSIPKPDTYADIASLVLVAASSVAFALRGSAWDKSDPNRAIYFERVQDGQDGLPGAKQTRNIHQRLQELNRDVVIFWGSQSGTAERLAHALGRQLHQRFQQQALVADLSDFDPESISELPNTALAIFILSTYGDGDPSDNASPFWEHLSRAVDMRHLQYVAFGLGNSQYNHYNRVIEVVDANLEKIGATRLAPVGKADDATNTTQEDFTAWRDDILFKMLREHRGWSEKPAVYEPELVIVEDESMEPTDLYIDEPVHAEKPTGVSLESSPIRQVRVQETRILFSTANRSCIHVEFDLTAHPQVAYKTGDHLAVWASNPDEEVDRLLSILGSNYLNGRQHIPVHVKLSPEQDGFGKIPVPSPTTVDALFRRHLEICAPVSRDTMRILADFAPSDAAKAFLLRLGNDKTLYSALHETTYINLSRVLELAAAEDGSAEDKHWPRLPLSFIIERCQSCSLAITRYPPQALYPRDIRASLLEWPTLTQQLSGETSMYAHIRRSKFKLPALSSTPLVMVAAGTGLAPFMAFINERQRMQSMGKEIGDMLLLFGCRAPDEDFIYKDELGLLKEKLTDKLQIVTAFSRSEGRCYVQDKLQEMKGRVLDIMEEGANLYICGRASMAREVGKVMSSSVKESQGLGQDGADQWCERLKKSRKWQEDVWG